MTDWNLESPDLHKFFFQEKYLSTIEELNNIPGIIDLFVELYEIIGSSDLEDEELANNALVNIEIEKFIIPTSIPNLSLLKAGRFDIGYLNRVNTFDWKYLYCRSASLFRIFVENLLDFYDYVLIDPSISNNDIKDICTMYIPKKLIILLAPSSQSFAGIKYLVNRVIKYRKLSDDTRPLIVYPLPYKIEFLRDDIRRNWRTDVEDEIKLGYQQMFEELFKEVYDLRNVDLNNYFNEVQIQQYPNYAYDKDLVIYEQTRDRLSISSSFEIFGKWIVDSIAPWQEKKDNISFLKDR